MKHGTTNKQSEENAHVTGAHRHLIAVDFERTFMLLVAIQVTETVDEGRIGIQTGPRQFACGVQLAFVVHVDVRRIVAGRPPAVQRGEVNGVGTALKMVHRARFKGPWCEEKRGKQKPTDPKDPTPDTGLTVTVGQPISLHINITVLSRKDLLWRKALKSRSSSNSTMNQPDVRRIGLVTGVQAGFVVGVFLGFSMAVVAALTRSEDLLLVGQLLCITPLVTAVSLGPVLGWRTAPVTLHQDRLPETRAALEPLNEGRGRWRVLSHVRSDGQTTRVDLHDARDPLAIVATVLQAAGDQPVRFVVGRGQPNSRSPSLRPTVLSHLEQRVPPHRLRSTRSMIEVMPEAYIEHLDATQRMHRRLLLLVPIAMTLVWYELR